MKKMVLCSVIFLLFLTMAFHRLSVVGYARTGGTAEAEDLYDASQFRNDTYYRTLQSWLSDYSRISYAEHAVAAADSAAGNPDAGFVEDESYGKTAVLLEEGDSFTYVVNVPETGLYEFGLDFSMTADFTTIPAVEVLINGESPFNEASSMELEVSWDIVPLPEEERYNRYGNELLPDTAAVVAWTTYWFDDYNGLIDGEYQFLLQSGTNTITLTALNLSLLAGDFRVRGHEDSIDYDTYRETTAGLASESEGEMIVIQGESFVAKNDLEVKSSYYKESAMTPYSYKTTVLNRLDGSSMARGGTSATYEFTVEKTGYYQIAFKCLHDTNLGVSSGKTLSIDGQILFSELSQITFDSVRKWQNVVLGDGDEAYEFYLEAGTHTLTVASTVSHYADYIDRLDSVMDGINSISLLVQTITGGNTDDAVDWDILKYIPDLQETLLAYADELEAIYSELDALDATLDSAPELSTLNVAAKQLRRVAKIPNRIGSKLNEFSEGSGSAYQLIGNAISALLSQPLSVDCIYVYEGVDLPKANGSFFRRAWDAIRGFFYSFFDARYNDVKVEEGTLDVWVQTSTLYLDILQNMIDSGFTRETGIKVQCSILTNTSKIVLSNATGDDPDVVLGIDDWTPYSYALRGLLTDLSQFEDFEEVSANYYANNFTPLIYDEGVYGIPETQSSFLLFYRKDILDYLDLEVPDTWEDVINILPILQSHQMNFYDPLGSDSAYKGFGFTSRFIYQFGGEVFTENGTASTLSDAKTVAAVKFFTELFTVHDLPLQVSSFFEHFRSGDMPIGIASVDMYLNLKYAAPELSGQWGVSVLPGIDADEDGTVERWSTSYGKASILFASSDMQEEGWELIKWWNSTPVQTEYMQRIKTELGEKYMVLTANMNALENSVWDEEIKDPIVAMAQWARIPAVTPGSYIVERELSAIWNAVVINRENVMVAINDSIPRINRELARKAEEFGYQSASADGKAYIVAMDSNIRDWIKEAYGDGE